MPENSKKIDLSYLIQFTKGDQGKLKKYLEMYLKSAPSVVNEFEQLLIRREYETLGLKAHSIKPQAQYLGIESLKEVLTEIELIGKNQGDYSKLQDLVMEAKTISDKVVVEIDEFLES